MAQKQETNGREGRCLRQFAACLLLFGLILAGRGLDLEPVEHISETVSRWVGADTDFRAVFSQMGESFSRGEPALETFHAFWTGLLPSEQDRTKETVREDAEGHGNRETTANE